MGKYDMFRAGNYVPFRQGTGKTLAVILLAAASGSFVAIEARDMAQRASWKVLPVKEYHTGDILLIANRWYNLSTYGACFNSFLSKYAMKTAFEDVGVVVMKGDVPHILFVEDKALEYMPLNEFLETRRPRGVAIRQLDYVKPELKPTLEISEAFIEEAKKITPEPRYVIKAAHRCVREQRYYNLAVERGQSMSRLEKKSRDHDISPAALKTRLERDKNIELVLKGYTEEKDFPHFEEFKLFNGSLVGSFLATFDLLDRELPPPTRYVPVDFLDHPLKHGTIYGEPFVIFKT